MTSGFFAIILSTALATSTLLRSTVAVSIKNSNIFKPSIHKTIDQMLRLVVIPCPHIENQLIKWLTQRWRTTERGKKRHLSFSKNRQGGITCRRADVCKQGKNFIGVNQLLGIRCCNVRFIFIVKRDDFYFSSKYAANSIHMIKICFCPCIELNS